MTPREDLPLIDEGQNPAHAIAAGLFNGGECYQGQGSAGSRVSADAFSSWPRHVLEQLAADLYSFIQDLGPMPRERLEQHTRYEAALRTIARQGIGSIYVQLARDTLNGK